MRQLHLTVIFVTLWAPVSCTLLPVFVEDPPDFAAPERALPTGADPNWTIPPAEVEPLVDAGQLTMISLVSAGAGTTGAAKGRVEFPDRDGVYDFKWKPMVPPRWVDSLPFAPGMLDGVNNSPRKEIAAWRIQRIFLDVEDYVAPPSIARCTPLDQVRKLLPDAQATLPDTTCKLGVFSLWLEDIEVIHPPLDDERFATDPVYAYYMANLNLFTFLIKHHDGRKGNFFISKVPDQPRLFAIDNGVSFGNSLLGVFYNWFVPNWNSIRVPALRKESIDRLRRVTEEELHEILGVVSELRLNERGELLLTSAGANLDDDRGVRWEDGVLQLGLTEEEIDDVWERIEDLIEDVDEGDVAVF